MPCAQHELFVLAGLVHLLALARKVCTATVDVVQDCSRAAQVWLVCTMCQHAAMQARQQQMGQAEMLSD